MLNLLSLATGIVAWVLGCWAIASKSSRKSHGLSVASFSMCSIALVSQLLEIDRLVDINDLSAVMDTIRAVGIAAVTLVVVNVVLNVIAVCRCKQDA